MNAGRLDELVTTLAPSTTFEDGEPTTTYASGDAFWASVREQSGSEAMKAGQVDNPLPVLVTGRYADTEHLSTESRIERENGDVLEIQSIRELGRRDGREMLCVFTGPGA